MHKVFALLSFFAIVALARADATYSWTGGSAGYAGTVVLDSTSSAGGSLADVVSITITDLNGTFTADNTSVLLDPTFTWTPTGITEMWIDWDSGLYGVGQDVSGGGVNFVGNNNNFGNTTSLDFAGSWTRVQGNSVPDGGSMLALFGLSLAAVAAFRLKFGQAQA